MKTEHSHKSGLKKAQMTKKVYLWPAKINPILVQRNFPHIDKFG